MNNMSKNNSSICSRSLFKAFKLTRMNKVIGNHMKLKMSIVLKKTIKQYNLGKSNIFLLGLRITIICLEMRWPMF